FTIEHTYLRSGVYQITYIERDRSAGVLNITNSTDTPYSISVTIDTDPKFGCNKLPVLEAQPLDRACSGLIFYHNAAAFDADGDSLSYELTTPASGEFTLTDYFPPNHSKFYTNFDLGNEAKNGPPLFTIDVATGDVTW